MIVDAHVHLWDSPPGWTAQPEFAALRRPFGLSDLPASADAVVLVQARNDAAETAELLSLGSPVVGWVDLCAPSVAASLEVPGLVGIRHLTALEADPVGWLSQSTVKRGLRAVAAAGLAYDLIVWPAQFAAAAAVVREHPDLTFVLDHLGKPFETAFDVWANGMRSLAALPNLSCKLSGLRPDWLAGGAWRWIEVALEAFGPERVMFGSDWPVSLVATSYAGVVEFVADLTEPLTPSERDSIFSRTAQRAYRLVAS